MSVEILLNKENTNIKDFTYPEFNSEKPVFNVYRDFSSKDLNAAKNHLPQKAKTKNLPIGSFKYDISDDLNFTKLLFPEEINEKIKAFALEIFKLQLEEYDSSSKTKKISLSNNLPIQNLAAIKEVFPEEFEKLLPEIISRKKRVDQEIEINDSEQSLGNIYWPGNILKNFISYKELFPETDIQTPFNNIWNRSVSISEMEYRIQELLNPKSNYPASYINDMLIGLGILKIIDKEKFDLFNIDENYYKKIKENYITNLSKENSDIKLHFAGAMTILSDPNPILTENGIKLSSSNKNIQSEILAFPTIRSF